MEEKAKLSGTVKGESRVALAFCIAILAICAVAVGWLTFRNFFPDDAETGQIIAGAHTTEDRYTLMQHADGTENFPMNVAEEIGDEYINRIEFQYGESQAGHHYMRTLFYLGEEEEKYGGYGDFWVNSEYESVENPLLLPEVADYDPLAEMGLSLPELFAQAKVDVAGLPEGVFYCADFPGAIGAKAMYGKNTIIYFYTEAKYKAAAIMFDWDTNLTHAAFYD